MSPKPFTPEQFRMAKAALNLKNPELSELTGIHRNTLNKVDNGEGSQATMNHLRLAFEQRGVIFLADGETTTGGPGVRLVGTSPEGVGHFVGNG